MVVDAIGEPVNVLAHFYGALCAIEAALLTTKLHRLILYEGVPLRGADGATPGAIDRLEDMLAAGDVRDDEGRQKAIASHSPIGRQGH